VFSVRLVWLNRVYLDRGCSGNKRQSFVAKYAGGERRLDVVEFIAVARALELDPKALIDQMMRD
jgi:hypothetical protein